MQRPGIKTVLLATTLRLASTARMAMALTDAGCRVIVVCPSNHWVHQVSRVHRILRYNGIHPLKSLQEAIIATKPDLIIPCDDRTVSHMQELATQSRDPTVVSVLHASLSSEEHFETTQSRYKLLMLARDLGIAIPMTHAIDDDRLIPVLTPGSGPWVVKADHSWAGMGVRVVNSTDEAVDAYNEMSRPMSLKTVVSEALIDRSLFNLGAWYRKTTNAITIQNFIDGSPANCAVACWHGQVIGCIAVIVQTTESLTGPATVIKVVDHPQMVEAAQQLVGALKITGMVGFDFIIDRSGKAFLLEMNPRNVPICHIALGGERDLVEQMMARLETRQPRDRDPTTHLDTITFFPFTWHTNPEDPALRSTYHDVPWEEPDLLRELLLGETYQRDRSALVRLIRLLRSSKSETAPKPALRMQPSKT